MHMLKEASAVKYVRHHMLDSAAQHAPIEIAEETARTAHRQCQSWPSSSLKALNPKEPCWAQRQLSLHLTHSWATLLTYHCLST